LRRAVRAGALHLDPYGPIVIDRDEFDIAAIGDQRRTDAIEPGLDYFTSGRWIIPCLRHLGLIGSTSRRVESGSLWLAVAVVVAVVRCEPKRAA